MVRYVTRAPGKSCNVPFTCHNFLTPFLPGPVFSVVTLWMTFAQSCSTVPKLHFFSHKWSFLFEEKKIFVLVRKFCKSVIFLHWCLLLRQHWLALMFSVNICCHRKAGYQLSFPGTVTAQRKGNADNRHLFIWNHLWLDTTDHMVNGQCRLPWSTMRFIRETQLTTDRCTPFGGARVAWPRGRHMMSTWPSIW